MSTLAPPHAARPPAAGRTGRRAAPRTRDRRGATAGYWVAAVLTCLVFLVPLAWAVLRAFQTSATISSPPSTASLTHLTWHNFRAIVSPAIGLWRFVLNSLLVSGGTAAAVAVVATLAGYGFARYRFRGSGPLLGVVLVSMMVPFQAILTPLFLELNAMHLTDSRLGLVLFSTTMNLPFGVFVMRNSFLTLPPEIEESARVDGASLAQTLLRVVRPLVLPGVLTVVLYAFLATWTDFLGALTFITKSDLVTLPVELSNLQQGIHGQVDYGYLASGAVISMIPCVVLYVSLQKHYVRGLTAGALKA
jgi:multiple sugar transport system permease protein